MTVINAAPKEMVEESNIIERRQGAHELLSKADRLWVEETIAKVAGKMSWLREKSADKIPYRTCDGVHEDKRTGEYPIDDGLQWWTNGFWSAMLWLMYLETGEEKYATIARKSEDWLDECFETFHGLHHDVGFMWLMSAVADYRLTANSDSRRRGLHAANLLAGRFNPVGRYIRAWDDLPTGQDTRGWAIIDCMFNLPLLYWAWEETGDPRFKHIAMMHADTAMESFIRPDGSSEHIVEFDPEGGGKLRAYGGQGYAEGADVGFLWFLYELCPYRQAGVSRDQSESGSLLFIQYSREWARAHRFQATRRTGAGRFGCRHDCGLRVY